MASSLDLRTRKRQYGKQWDQWIELLRWGNIPEKVREEYTSGWFSALYKDYDGERDKLRPTVCGTGLRRLSESFMAYILRSRMAETVLPHNLATGIDNGCQLLAFSVMIETEQSIKRDPMKMIEDPPTHMLFELDFTCMFNMINREVTAELLETEMPELYHYFWATYGHPLKHYYAQENGETGTFTQEEGFVQGGSMSGLFAAIAIKPLLKKCVERSNARRKKFLEEQRQPGVAKNHSVFLELNPLAWVDDVYPQPAVDDAEYFLRDIINFGPAYGAVLNLTS